MQQSAIGKEQSGGKRYVLDHCPVVAAFLGSVARYSSGFATSN
jgi:hypothetical protein